MEKTTHHPLRAWEDALKRALVLNGFSLHDDGKAPEVEKTDWAFKLQRKPNELNAEPILLEGGRHALRSELLAAQLSSIEGPLPVKSFSAGRVYDGRDHSHPGRTRIEGIWADNSFNLRECARFWDRIAEQAFGIGANTELVAFDENAYTVLAHAAGKTFSLACIGEATDLAKALLGISKRAASVWAFTIDVDTVAIGIEDLQSRASLYDPTMSFLEKFANQDASLGSPHRSRACNVLRMLGFAEFFGPDAYEADCYKKMNMIQESWDANNRGLQLANALGPYTGLPTVLAPSLEEALAANYRIGEKECMLFEMRHVFLPPKNGADPLEKTALSFGGYGPALDKAAWKALVGTFLASFGISNHFFIPTDRAIAYDTTDCWLVMDQNMRYLESNFGSISPKALDNHGIETQAFMAQFEFAELEKKADEELDFIAPELR